MAIGDKIRALRKEKGMTQDAIAEALDVTRQAVAKWESNQAAPSTTNIMKLAELFQVQFQDLLSQEEIPNAEIQKYIVKVAQAEEKRKEKRAAAKGFAISGLKISGCYLVLFLLCWVVFHLIGAPDYIWSWSTGHYIFLVTYLYSLAGCLLYHEKLGYYTLAGTAVGLILGNIVGSITSNNSVLRFNHGWIALLACIGAFSLFGIVVSFAKTERGKAGDHPLTLSKKSKRLVFGALSLCLAIFIIFGAGVSARRLAFDRGASIGYNAGFEQGLHDKENGLPSDSSVPSSGIPEDYRFGTSAYSGYMIYWPTGYQDGYGEGR